MTFNLEAHLGSSAHNKLT